MSGGEPARKKVKTTKKCALCDNADAKYNLSHDPGPAGDDGRWDYKGLLSGMKMG